MAGAGQGEGGVTAVLGEGAVEMPREGGAPGDRQVGLGGDDHGHAGARRRQEALCGAGEAEQALGDDATLAGAQEDEAQAVAAQKRRETVAGDVLFAHRAVKDHAAVEGVAVRRRVAVGEDVQHLVGVGGLTGGLEVLVEGLLAPARDHVEAVPEDLAEALDVGAGVEPSGPVGAGPEEQDAGTGAELDRAGRQAGVGAGERAAQDMKQVPLTVAEQLPREDLGDGVIGG